MVVVMVLGLNEDGRGMENDIGKEWVLPTKAQ